jgi:16S rRNA (guanine1207-N2)-methyltransferase
MEAARANINRLAPKLSARYFWQDLAREEVKNKYDLIVMNPPFHEGHAAEPQLGQAMIKTASNALKSGGELLLVANRGLPYEPFLKEHFKTSGEVARNARYKVLSGKK